MLIFDTICSLATPPFKSALATVRLSGDKTLDILSHIIKKDISTIEPNKAYFVKLYKDKNSDEIIDEVVLTFYKGPKSYTGFDSADFSTHGSMIIVEELINTLIKYGARRANKGEFSAQAYYNNKMDLLKAEGINDLINANSKRGKELATKTLNGENSTTLKNLKNNLLNYLAQLEYYVENQYMDEDSIDYEMSLHQISINLLKDIQNVENLLNKIVKANREYKGFNIAIVGEPNVGKSTLLNALLQKDRAIVSPIPGTTRDIVDGNKEINGILFRFIDTAGIRESEDLVENLGIERSYSSIENSDLILLCSDNGFKNYDKNERLLVALKDKKIIKITTKSDINNSLDGDISLSAINDDLKPLEDLILSKLDLIEKEDSEFLGEREEDYIRKIYEKMKEANDALLKTYQVDIISDTLRIAIALINDMMGHCENQTMEDIYQTLFSKFCLGK